MRRKIIEVLAERGESNGVQLQRADPALNRSGIYVILGRMRESHQVTMRIFKPEGERGWPRKYYTPTAESLAALNELRAQELSDAFERD